MLTQHDKTLDLGKFKNVIGSEKPIKHSEIVRCLDTIKNDLLSDRVGLEHYWRSYYYSYLTTDEAKRRNLTRAAQELGSVKVSWRHNLKTPKAYETVETLVSYFMAAFFPNERWFSLTPREYMAEPDYLALVELNRAFINQKLVDAKFQSQKELFLREVCITGTACMMLPWQQDNVTFTVLSPFEFLLGEGQDPNKVNFIRKYELPVVAAQDYADKGVYDLVGKVEAHRSRYDYIMGNDELRDTLGHVGLDRINPDKKTVTLYEFWGDLCVGETILKNVRATWNSSGQLLNIDDNPYGDDKPFIIGTYLRTLASPYGIGALQPISSQLRYRDVLSSRHADTVAVSADPMVEYVQDGVIDPDDLTVEPGKKIPVTKANSINPVVIPYQGGITINEQGIVEMMADKAIGTGPYIAAGAGRNAERVTAEEVSAQRQAGGQRLTTVFSGLERDVLIPLLELFHSYCRKFYKGGYTMTIQEVYVVQVNKSALKYPMKVKALGANNVADKEYNLRQILEYLNIVGQNPKFTEVVNWEALLKELTYLMIPQIAEKVLQAAPQQQSQNPLAQEAMETAQRIGGNSMARGVQEKLLAGTLDAGAAQLQQNLGLEGVQNV